MIGCGMGVRGAMRIGEMLERNASLMTVDLMSECTLNLCTFTVVINAFWWQMSTDEKS
jgi:hypothetical protein